MVEQEKNDSVNNEDINETEEAENVEVIIEDIDNEDEPDSTETELTALQKEKDEIYDRMLRIQAEYDNFKKRTQREKASDLKYKSQELVNELLPALDNFERAIEVETTEEIKGIMDGITMVYNQLLDALKSQGVEVIEAEGNEFDPNLHHAVMQVEDETIDSNVVVEELQKGYMLKDRVIRAAMVKVNK